MLGRAAPIARSSNSISHPWSWVDRVTWAEWRLSWDQNGLRRVIFLERALQWECSRRRVVGATLCSLSDPELTATGQRFWTPWSRQNHDLRRKQAWLTALNLLKVHLKLKDIPCDKFPGINMAPSELPGFPSCFFIYSVHWLHCSHGAVMAAWARGQCMADHHLPNSRSWNLICNVYSFSFLEYGISENVLSAQNGIDLLSLCRHLHFY